MKYEENLRNGRHRAGDNQFRRLDQLPSEQIRSFERIRIAVTEHDDQKFVSAPPGYLGCAYAPSEGKCLEELVRLADARMYASKQAKCGSLVKLV